MALSKRLLALYRWVEKGSIAADIGCDHALLSIALIENRICSHVYACDLRKAPLARAEETIRKLGLQNQITTCLQDGLQGLPEDVNCVIIAGMGADTILHILEQEQLQYGDPRRFIIQTNTHPEEIRAWISQNGFRIIGEDLVEEDHFYQVIVFECKKGETLTEADCLLGVFLKEHPLYPKFWNFYLQKQYEILNNLPDSHSRYQEIKHLCTLIETTLKKTTNK